MKIFNNYMLSHFEKSMVVHLYNVFPNDCNALGETEVRNIVHYGIERARFYGIVIEQDVSKFINLMFLFGRDFDTDPAFPWAAKILNEDYTGKGLKKIDVLYDKASRRFQDSTGIIPEARKGS